MSLVKAVSKSVVRAIGKLPATQTPAMKKVMEVHSPMLKKVAPELPRFREVLATMKKEDFKIAGLIVNDDAQVALGEFYLALALRLHPDRIEAAGDNNNALLKVAFETAELEFEPWLKEIQEFVSDYQLDVHDEIEVLKVKHFNGDFCEGTYWTKFFEAIAPKPFGQLQEGAQTKADVLTTHELVDEFVDSKQEIVEELRVLTADTVLFPFKKDVRALLAENGLLLLPEELQSAVEAQKASFESNHQKYL
eukprot:GDKJ01013718.1.p1 GENE.GDKJ01013718.1~~GDKJ01013718.1.p1  ORF type:complete len:250 (-),score=78.93 GDKJ01013718.1:116-865(-)